MPYAVTHYRCNDCDEQFNYTWLGKAAAERHEDTHHGLIVVDFSCKCGRDFRTQRGLRQHIDYPGRAQ